MMKMYSSKKQDKAVASFCLMLATHLSKITVTTVGPYAKF